MAYDKRFAKVAQTVLRGRTLRCLRFDCQERGMSESALLREIITKHYQVSENLPKAIKPEHKPRNGNDIG